MQKFHPIFLPQMAVNTRLPSPPIVKRNEPLPLEIIVHKDADSPAWMFLSAYKSQLLNRLELDPRILLALTPKSG